MPCLDRALTEVRASLTWTIEEIVSDAEAPEGWSNPETRTHVLLAPRHPGSRLALLRELVHAALCEHMPRLYASSTVWGVSLGGQVVARKHYLRATREWYAAARLAGLCPDEADAALANASAAARERLATVRPFVLDRLNLGPDERGRLADGLVLAQVRRRLDPAADTADPVTGAVAAAYGQVDPEAPDMPGFLAVVNGLCAATGRRPFTPVPRKGYWMVRESDTAP